MPTFASSDRPASVSVRLNRQLSGEPAIADEFETPIYLTTGGFFPVEFTGAIFLTHAVFKPASSLQ